MNHRLDRRYKDPDTAPSIVNERRMTFFLSDDAFRALRLQTGYNQIANSEGEDSDDPLPESPSAVLREAVQFWLDQFAPFKERARTPKEWDVRLGEIRRAMGKGKK